MDHDSTDRIGHYTGILAVDVRQYSRHNSARQDKITELLDGVLRKAADRADLRELFQDNSFHAYRGDGYLIGFPPSLVAPVVDRYFDSLQAELRRRATDLRANGIELRLRASLHLGPVRSFDALVADSPAGKVMVESGRMIDTAPVRALLDHSDPEVTLVATMVSEEVMKQVIEAGHTVRKASEFVAAPLRLDTKGYAGTGYLRVPVPSGELLRQGLLHGQPDGDTEEPTGKTLQPDDLVSNSFSGKAKQSIQAGTVHGGIHDSSARASGGGIAVTGDGNVTAGHTVDRSSGKQVFSGQFETQGDANFGPSSGRRIGRHDDPAGR